MRGLYRKAKDTWKQYDDAEVRVREATSNDPWGASSTMMSRISDDCDHPLRYQSMFTMLYKRMTDYKHYKHVLKSLHLIDYLLKHANSRFVHDMTLRKETLKDLTQYKFVENGIDCGEEIRKKADQILDLLEDEEKLREEREAARNTKGRISALDHKSSIGSFRADDRMGRRGSGSSNLKSKYDEEVEWENVDDISPLENDDSEELRQKRKPKGKKGKKIASPDLEFDDAAFEEKELSVEEVEEPAKQKTPERRRTPSPRKAPVVAEKPRNKNSFLDELDLPTSNAVKPSRTLDDIFGETVSGIDSLFDNVKPAAALALPAPEEEKKEVDPMAMIDVSFLEQSSPKEGEEWTYLTNFDDLHVPMTKVRAEKKKQIKKAITNAKPTLSKVKEEKGGELVVYNPAANAAGAAYGYGYYPSYNNNGYSYGHPAAPVANPATLNWN